MIDTVTIKQQMPAFRTGTGLKTILIVGSCRAVAYLNYLHRYNETHGQPFSIYFIEPHNFHWVNEPSGERLVDLQEQLTLCETDPRILDVLHRADIYIHEHYAAFGMFNSLRASEKNIWQFGLRPGVTEIALPNFHDHFVLAQEQVQFNAEGLADFIKSGKVQEEDIVAKIRAYGLADLERFYEVCRKSSFPEFADHFKTCWQHVRFFWTGNHVSKNFTLYLFRQMNDRFLGLQLGGDFWPEACKEDLFAFPNTPVTQYDVDAYGFSWPGMVVEPIKLP